MIPIKAESETVPIHHSKTYAVIARIRDDSLTHVSEIDAVIITHAHLDHTGYLPLLVRNGFRGKIFGTEATLDLAKILLLDSAKLQELDADYANRKSYSKHQPALLLYTTADAKSAIDHLSEVPLDHWNPLIELENVIHDTIARKWHLIIPVFLEIPMPRMRRTFFVNTLRVFVERKGSQRVLWTLA